MTWEGVPWMIANGAEHSAEVGRLLAYAAIGGAEGVIGPPDCKVTASAIPDANIHIAAGGVAILNRYVGGGQQAYLARNLDDEVYEMTPQGSSGARYDLVCVIIEDNQYPGQPDPVDAATGPYLKTVVYEDVPSTTTKLSQVEPDQAGYALARVRFNASDGTVVAGDITDLRQLVQPRSKVVKRVYSLPSGTEAFPTSAYANSPAGASAAIDIPEWAQRVILEATWAGPVFADTSSGAGSAAGSARVQLGSINTATTSWAFDATASNKPIRGTLVAAEDMAVASGLRGTSQTLSPQLWKGAGTGMNAYHDAYGTVVVTATFYESVE